MKPEDIIRMAREAGAKSPDLFKLTVSHMSTETLERFAALVAAAERNECAKIVDRNADGCVGVMEYVLRSNADAIRARGNT